MVTQQTNHNSLKEKLEIEIGAELKIVKAILPKYNLQGSIKGTQKITPRGKTIIYLYEETSSKHQV